VDRFGNERKFFARGVNWTEKLFEELILSDQPVLKLFSGLPGSGKTTELKRLKQKLSETECGNFLTVYINAENVIDLSDKLNVFDVLAAMVAEVEKEVNAAIGDTTSENEGYFFRLWHWLTKTDVQLKGGQFTVPNLGKLTWELKNRPSLRQHIREVVNGNFTQFLSNVELELTQLHTKAKEKLDKDGIVVIFDALDKLRGYFENWVQVLESAEHLFGGGAPHLKLPIHAIYTVPAALATRIRGIDFLPMIKVRHKHGRPCEDGMNAALALIQRRVPREALEEIFGEQVESRVRDLILGSGGYIRELVQMLQAAIMASAYPLDQRAFDLIFSSIDNDYRRLVPSEAFAWLAQVAHTRFLTVADGSHRAAADQMMSNHAVMCYHNKDLWYDLHPSVAKIEGIRDAVAKLAKDRPKMST
jgi:DNA polymerase III delta prime subunit